jgi:3-hydroxyisobutyrate dehydrogenase
MLDAVAGAVEVCGLPGSGQLAKCALALNQVAQMVALVESDALCRVTADGATSAAVMKHAVAVQAVNPRVQKIFEAIENKEFASSYAVEVMMGELESALAAADEIDLIMPQAEAAEYLLQLLSMIGGVAMAPATLSLVYGDEANCAKYGLDWTRAEEAYASFGGVEDDDDDYDDYDDEEDEPHHHHHHHGFDDDDYSGSFGGYSSN